MNQDWRAKIGSAWARIAEMTGRPLSRGAVSLMLDSVSELPPEKVFGALETWLKENKQLRYPLPAEIRDMCGVGKISIDAEARESASRICSAIRNFGYTNAERAKEYIGDLGWRVVERNGGWTTLCESVMDDQIGIFQAQARDLARATLERAQYGMIDAPPSLPKIENKNKSTELLSVGEILSGVLEMRDKK